MLQVKLNEATNDIEIRFKYNSSYINRIKAIGGCSFNGEAKCWTISDLMFPILQEEFKGEIMYMTPEWVLTGGTPPDYNKIYKHVSKVQPTLKAPYKPYPFQSFGANFLASMSLKYGFSCLLDDMGTGKTIQSITAGKIIDQQVGLDQFTIPILVVCKSSLKYQWVTDGVNKFTDDSSIVIDGTKKKRKKLYDEIMSYPGRIKYVIVGYETVREDIDILEQIDIGLAIFDEAHKIRNRETKANKACRNIKSKYTFFLTGSPISKDPSEIFGLGVVGNKKFFGTWKQFQEDYITAVRGQYGMEYFYHDLDDLRSKIDTIALRRTEVEIDMDMPTIIEQNIFVEMSKIQQQIDEDIMNRNADLQNELLSIGNSSKISQEDKERREKIEAQLKGLMALRVGCADSAELFALSNSAQIRGTYGEMAKKDKTSPKLSQLIEHVQEIVDSGHKVVIFTKFETMTRIIQQHLSKLKVGSDNVGVVLFTGKMDAKAKEDARIRFKTRSDCHVFCGTNAAAEGLNLQEARYLINFDLDWDIGINDQRNKRIRRLDSQFKRVYVYNYIAQGSADELVLKALENKQQLFDYLIANNQEQSKQMKIAMGGY